MVFFFQDQIESDVLSLMEFTIVSNFIFRKTTGYYVRYYFCKLLPALFFKGLLSAAMMMRLSRQWRDDWETTVPANFTR